MATLEELSRALIKADAAGDAVGAKVLADAIRDMRAQESAPAQMEPVAAPKPSLSELLTASPTARAQMGLPPLGAEQAAPIGNANNPMASSLPGFLGDFANTLRAATRGSQDAAMLNLSDELTAGVTGLPQVAANAIQGQGVNFDPVAEEYKRMTTQRQQTQALNPDAYGVGSTLGTVALMGKAGAPAGVAMPSALRTGATAAAYGGLSGIGAGETPGERLMGGATGAATGAILGWGANKLLTPAKAPPPTVKSLFSDAKAGFKAAENTGAVVPQAATKSFVEDARRMLDDEGLITPSGKIADMPKVSHALDLADEYAAAAGNLPAGLAQPPMTIQQAMKMRRALRRAAGSIDGEERRIGVILLNKFDDMVEKSAGAAAPLWATARQNYHVASKGASVEKLISTASRKAKKSRGVSGEATLRTQFDNFISKDKNLRGFSPPEQAQLSRVANGTVGGNIARGVGNLAPTTLSGLTVKGGVPFAVGNAIGGPAVGATLAGSMLAVGGVGRLISSLSTRHQAELARILVLNGGKVPSSIPQNISPQVAQVLGNITLLGGAKAPEIGQQLLQLLSRSQPESIPAM